MVSMLTPFEQAFIAHLIADWLFQNDWMARNKSKFFHPATWVHASIHAVLLGIALGWVGGVVLALIHILIDTRAPLNWWRSFFRQTADGPYAILTAVWSDQVLHLVTIAVWVLLTQSVQLTPVAGLY